MLYLSRPLDYLKGFRLNGCDQEEWLSDDFKQKFLYMKKISWKAFMHLLSNTLEADKTIAILTLPLITSAV